MLPLNLCWNFAICTEFFSAICLFLLCHVAASQDDTCLDVHAKWLKLGNRWLEEFPWLECKRDGSGRVVLAFCKACKLYGDFHAEFRTCKSLQKSHFEEHSKTKRHQAAVSNPDIRLGIVAPPVPVFVEALQLVRQGKAGGPQGTKTLKREKLLKAKFCLAETLRIQSRLRLLECNGLTLHSDASKGRLVLRGQGCGAELKPVHVLLGCKKLEEFDAQGIVKCILSMLAEFCTPFLHVDWFQDAKHQEAMGSAACPVQEAPELTGQRNPTSVPGSCPDLDKHLLKHVLQMVEVFNADAAADEQLAGQLLASDVSAIVDAATFGARRGDGVIEAMEVATASFKQVFPNLKVINKDKPHGARRIVSRTFKCDPVLNNLVDKVFMSSDSIVQQIHFSDVVRHVYAQTCAPCNSRLCGKKCLRNFPLPSIASTHGACLSQKFT